MDKCVILNIYNFSEFNILSVGNIKLVDLMLEQLKTAMYVFYILNPRILIILKHN